MASVGWSTGREGAAWPPRRATSAGPDHCMNTATDGRTIAGICHARGVNAKMPPQWMIYITVKHLDASLERCLALGGHVIDGPREMGDGRCAVIQDPAGAVAALYEPT